MNFIGWILILTIFVSIVYFYCNKIISWITDNIFLVCIFILFGICTFIMKYKNILNTK